MFLGSKLKILKLLFGHNVSAFFIPFSLSGQNVKIPKYYLGTIKVIF